MRNLLTGALVTTLFCTAGGCGEEGPHRPPTMRAQTAALGSETLLWTQRSEMRRRVLPSLVDQPSRQRLLAYGGFTTDGVLADTWEWDGLGWIRRTPSTNPGPRSAAATTFDSKRQRVLLFGGVKLLAPPYPAASAELWQWNGSEWSTVSTPHAPPSVAGAVFTWDPETHRGLLFSGGTPVPTQDGNAEMQAVDLYWSFDGRDWSEIAAPQVRPAARAFASSIWDPIGKRMLVHGGFRKALFVDGLVAGKPEDLCNDTWSWDGTTWVQFAQGAVESEYGLTSMGYDPESQRVLLIVERPTVPRTDGQGTGETSLYALEGDTWKWVSARPLADEEGTAVSGSTVFSTARWSSANRAMLSWGGIAVTAGAASAGALKGIWLTTTTGSWSHRGPSVRLDPLLETASAAVSDEAILFGGYSGVNERRNQTYGWDGGRWTLLAPRPAAASPAARSAHAMATLGENQVLLFGGYDGTSDLQDTWVWDHPTRSWSELVAQDAPPARQRAAMAKLGDDEVVLFGGQAGGTPLGDTWIFSARTRTWRPVTPSLTPPARHSATMAHEGKGALLFSGLGAGDAILDDRWRFDDGRWTESEQNNVTQRYRGQMAHEAVSGRTFLVGGTGDTLRPDVWDFTSDPATPLLPVVRETNELPPRRRQWFSLVPSPRSGSVVEFGGKSDDGDDERFDDTWQLRSYGLACSESAECGPGRFCTDGVCCEASSCGPCRTCASAAAPGFCTARGVYGPEAECGLEEGLSCGEDGACRLANEQACTSNAQCATSTCVGLQTGKGTCCALEGCVVRCDGNDLRNPDGTKTSCGTYGCEGQSCKTSCTSVTDCAGTAVCVDGTCIIDDPQIDDDGGCACRVHAPPTSTSFGAWAWLTLCGLTAVRRRRARP